MKYLVILALGCASCLLVAPTELHASDADSWIDRELQLLKDQAPDADALQRWQQRLEQEPDNLRLRGDYAVLLARSGQLDEALSVVRHRPWQHYPAYVAETLAAILRAHGRDAEAIELLSASLKQYPQRPQLHAELIIALASSAAFTAQTHADQLTDSVRQTAPVQSALGWLARQRGQHALAAMYYRRARQLGGDHPWLFNEEVQALQASGLHHEAWLLGNQQPDWLTDQQRLTLAGDAAAWFYRLALAETDSSRWYDQALEALERHCDLAYAQQHGQEIGRCEGTRIRLMSARGAHADALSNYRRAFKASITLDQEVHLAALDSSLALSDIRSAQRIAQRIEPLPIEQQATLLMLTEQPAAARALMEQARDQQPIWIWGAGSDRSHENFERLALEQEIIRSLAWENRLAESQQALEPLLQAAPRHTGLRLQMAELYRWRGWPDRADREYDQVEAVEPASMALHRARFSAEMDRRAWRRAGQHLQTIDQHTLAPARASGEHQRWQTATGPWLIAGMRTSRGANDLDPAATRSLNSYAELYSAAWTRLNDTRAFVRYSRYYNRQTGDDQRLERAAVGVHTGHRDGELELAWVTRLGGEGQAVNVRGGYRFSDHWRVDGHWQGDSDATPLRAASNDIDLRTTQLALTYNVESGHQYRGQITHGSYSDDNRNLSASLGGRQPLYARGPHQWAVYEDLSITTNSEQNTPYYSPEQAIALTGQLEYRGILHALMEQRWTHRALLGAGVLNEKGAGTSLIGQLEYGHQWQASRHLSLELGAAVTSREYAGDREQEYSLQGSLLWRWR